MALPAGRSFQSCLHLTGLAELPANGFWVQSRLHRASPSYHPPGAAARTSAARTIREIRRWFEHGSLFEVQHHPWSRSFRPEPASAT